MGSAFAPVISGPSGLFPDARTDLGQRIGGIIFSATVGGFASVAGGGKFANGAITSAFGYLYNQVAPPNGVSVFGLSAATSADEGQGYSVQQDVDSKYQEISRNVSIVAGGQLEVTGANGAQFSGGVFLTFSPFDAGGFASAGWMNGVNVGWDLYGGFMRGGASTLSGSGGTFGVSSAAGGYSVSFDSSGQPTSVYVAAPAPKFGDVSGGVTQTCVWPLRYGGSC